MTSAPTNAPHWPDPRVPGRYRFSSQDATELHLVCQTGSFGAPAQKELQNAPVQPALYDKGTKGALKRASSLVTGGPMICPMKQKPEQNGEGAAALAADPTHREAGVIHARWAMSGTLCSWPGGGGAKERVFAGHGDEATSTTHPPSVA